jgi:hypothetical protein
MFKSASRDRSRPGSVFRGAVGAGALALVAAACSSSSGQPSAAASHTKSPMPEMSSSMPMASPSMSMVGGALPMGAKDMRLTITAPASGIKVTGDSVTVHVMVTGYTDTCALAGKHVMGMEATTSGHYHVLLDGSLINMFCTPTAVVSLQNVKPGMHTPHGGGRAGRPRTSGRQRPLDHVRLRASRSAARTGGPHDHGQALDRHRVAHVAGNRRRHVHGAGAHQGLPDQLRAVRQADPAWVGSLAPQP